MLAAGQQALSRAFPRGTLHSAPCALRKEFAAEELQADRDLVLAAVRTVHLAKPSKAFRLPTPHCGRTSGMALSFAAAPLRCDRVGNSSGLRSIASAVVTT